MYGKQTDFVISKCLLLVITNKSTWTNKLKGRSHLRSVIAENANNCDCTILGSLSQALLRFRDVISQEKTNLRAGKSH